jgi:hypothetical protein
MKKLMLKLDKRDMIFQEIEIRDKAGKPIGRFHVCRHFGSRECWVESTVLADKARRQALATPFVWREVEVDGGRTIKVVSVEWLLEHFKPDPYTRQWFESLASVFDCGDNSKGQLVGTKFADLPKPPKP